MKKKILITGANGFIGKSLTELLNKDKYEIIPITKPSTARERTAFEYDIQDEMDVDRMFDFFQNIDYVIHCATVGGRRNKPETPYVFATNVMMFNNLIKHKDKYKHMFTFGSGAENNNDGFPIDYYGLSKKYIYEKVKNQKLSVSILRLWGCFGKYETDDRFIKANIIRYLNKEDIIIHENKIMDFYYIKDVIPVIELIIDLKNTTSISYWWEVNLTYRQKYSLYDIAGMINKLKNYKVDISTKTDPSGEYHYYYSLYDKVLDNFQLIGLEQGIRDMAKEIENGL